jgi:hypothetical protein
MADAAGWSEQTRRAAAIYGGVFSAADMPGFVREMWRLVRPGGTQAVTGALVELLDRGGVSATCCARRTGCPPAG